MSDRTESNETDSTDTITDDTTMTDTDRADETDMTATERRLIADGGTSTASEAVDTDVSESDEPNSEAGPEPTTDQTDDGVFGSRFRRWVNYLVLAALAILALVAGIRFYAAIGTIIDRFVVREFRPVFHAVFNLALLFLAGAGVTIQLKRMR